VLGESNWVVDAFNFIIGSSYKAELTALVSMTILCLTKSLTAWPCQNDFKKRRKVVESNCSLLAKAAHAPSLESAPERSGLARSSSNPVSKLNRAIDTEARRGNVQKAEQLLLQAEASDVKPDSVSYNMLIRACAKRGDNVAAEQWMKHMELNGVTATVCSYNTLLDAFAKANQAEACEKCIGHMLARGLEGNVISYATVMYAHAKRGDVRAAESWLRKMIAAGVKPDVVSYNSLIHACSVKGAARAAEHWLHEMLAQGLETTVSTYTAVIDACAKSGDVERAETWFACMLDKKVEPNVITFSAMIDACAKAGNLPRAEHWHERMLEEGIAPNAHSYTALINACAKRADASGAEAAEQWLDRSEQAGVVNDVVVYSSVIDACGKAKDAERALRVFHRMQSMGVKPHIIAYSALARPFAYRGDWIKVETIAKDMQKDGIATNEYFTYAQILSYATSRPRQAHRAETYFREAHSAGVNINDHVVGVLARAVGRPRCTELMAELCGGREVPLPPQRKGHESVGRGAVGKSAAVSRA